MQTRTQAPDRLFGYDVIDSAGNKIGSVDGVWVDDATGALEFVGAKTGWHIVPVENAQIDDANRTISVPFGQDQIKDAPSFGADDELSPDDENEIYRYYGMDRSTATSPSGYGMGEGTAATAGTAGYTGTDTGAEADMTDTGERGLKLSEEELQVGKRPVQEGEVRLRKVVRTEQQEVPVELRREDVEVERMPASGQDVPDTAFQEQEINVPVMREEPVVGKEARVTGEVRVDKTADTETRTVGGQIRREDVEVDKDTDTDVLDRTDQNL
jgi:uncharacterized protein (TIGR02271 family)